MAVPHCTHIAPEGAQPHPGCNPAAAEHLRDPLSLRDGECLRPGSLRPQRVVNVGASCRSNGHYRHEEGRLSRQRGRFRGFIWFPAFCFRCLSFAGGGEGVKGRADPVTSILRAGVGVKSLLDAPLQRTKGAGSHLCQEVSSFRFSVLAYLVSGILRHLQTKPGCTERGVNYSSCSLPLPLNC